MLKIDNNGTLKEPATRSDLVFEILRLRKVARDAITVMSRINKNEADIIRIALERDTEYTQPDVGDESISGHFYDDTQNAGRYQNDR